MILRTGGNIHFLTLMYTGFRRLNVSTTGRKIFHFGMNKNKDIFSWSILQIIIKYFQGSKKKENNQKL